MKIAFLNLPNKFQVIRRYMCSYNAPNFLFPPLELMYLASVARSWNRAEVQILDAIAHKMDIIQVESALDKIKPDMVVFISGFEIFQEDIQAAVQLKRSFPQAKFVIFGYLPTIFAEQVLTNTNMDFCVMDEPEMTFSELCHRLSNSLAIDEIEGLAFNNNGRIKINPRRSRIQNLNDLPHPARDLVDNNLYGEPFMKRPFTLIQSARGCPFNCTYCVKSFGSQFICRSAENIVAEIEECVKVHEIRTFRFIDDTFNATRPRVDKISQMILDRGLKVEWTALSRADTVEPETLKLMRQSGCRRLYVGIESGSQRILDLYKKGYRRDKLKRAVGMVNNSGIESVGFFMVGAPGENEQDFKESVKLAKESNLDYIVVFKTISYPGTTFFNQFRDQIEFSLFPYVNRLKDSTLDKRYNTWERIFYLKYYLRFTYIIKRLVKLLKNPIQSLKNLFYIARYVFFPMQKSPRTDLI